MTFPMFVVALGITQTLDVATSPVNKQPTAKIDSRSLCVTFQRRRNVQRLDALGDVALN
jgi:hypothetical protein